LKTLYARDNKGQIRTWSVEELEDGLMINHGTLNGLQQEKFEDVVEGLATRTLEEQIHSRALSRIKRKKDAGYCETLEEAETKPRTNSMGLVTYTISTSMTAIDFLLRMKVVLTLLIVGMDYQLKPYMKL